MQESDKQRSLAAALRGMADDDAELGASPGVEARLLAEVRSIAAGRRRRTFAAALAIAAALLLALAVPAWRMTGSDTVSDPVGVGEVTTEFLPLLYSSIPAGHVQMVRLAVPREALASFGLAPLEVGDDGLARAVRFVRPAADQERTP